MAGLVIEAQHRLTKTGKNFGVLHVEDFSSKAEFMLWSEEYVKYSNYLEVGRIIMIEGSFKQRYNTDQYEFKITKMHLLETVKPALTKQVIIETSPQFIDDKFIQFIEENLTQNPGKTILKFNIKDHIKQQTLSLSAFEKSFTMNDEMAEYLLNHKNIDVAVEAN
jgi:DNA polymerase-3 subunit alpha